MMDCNSALNYIKVNKQHVIQGEDEEFIDKFYEKLDGLNIECLERIKKILLEYLRNDSITLEISEDFKIYWEILELNNYSEIIDLSLVALHHPDLSYRERYFYYLLEFDSEKVVHFFLEYIKTDHSDEFIGNQTELAIYYLTRNKVLNAYPAILRLVKNEYANVRSAAISFIEELNIVDAVPFLDTHLMEEEDIDNVESIVKFIAKIDYKPALKTLQTIEKDEWVRSDEEVHQSVLESIQKLEK